MSLKCLFLEKTIHGNNSCCSSAGEKSCVQTWQESVSKCCTFVSWLKTPEELSQISSPEIREESSALKQFSLGFVSTFLSGANINTTTSEMGFHIG